MIVSVAGTTDGGPLDLVLPGGAGGGGALVCYHFASSFFRCSYHLSRAISCLFLPFLLPSGLSASFILSLFLHSVLF